MDKGWASIHRQIEEHFLYFSEPFTKAQAWIDIILFANFEDATISIRGNIIKLKRGQLGWSEVTMAKRWTWSRNKVRRFLKLLEMEQQIEQQKTSLTSIITIVNYNSYQRNGTTDDTAERQQKDSRRYTDNKSNKNNKNNNIKEKTYKKENSHSPDGSLGEKVLKVKKDSTDNPIVEDTKTKKRKSSAKKKKDIEDFDKFWAVYPRKTAKGGARKAFAKALSKTITDVMITAVERQKHQEQWTKDDGTYIPHPATWLNQECWEDEVKGGYSQKESDRDIDWSKVELPIINP